jgi:hypothetical protein
MEIPVLPRAQADLIKLSGRTISVFHDVRSGPISMILYYSPLCCNSFATKPVQPV